jgi:hypothetical protein
MAIMRHLVATVLSLSIIGGAAVAAVVKLDLPGEVTGFKQGPGAELAGQCLICHSADYVIMQPRDKPLAFWKAEVEKMKKVYGAPIADDQIEPLSQYLARNYGTSK